MKIEGSLPGTALTGATNQAPVRAKDSATSSLKQDSVSLSDTSSQMQALEASVNQAPGFDAAKVEAIKQAISEGRFKINPEQIADNLIASTRELVAQHKA
jgi:negative regulator of flagellin synthesis FlgM